MRLHSWLGSCGIPFLRTLEKRNLWAVLKQKSPNMFWIDIDQWYLLTSNPTIYLFLTVYRFVSLAEKPLGEASECSIKKRSASGEIPLELIRPSALLLICKRRDPAGADQTCLASDLQAERSRVSLAVLHCFCLSGLQAEGSRWSWSDLLCFRSATG